MHGLGTLTRGTQRILATFPLRCGLSHKENRPGPMGEGPGRMPHVRGRERPTRGDWQSAPWREEDAQGTLAFRNGYFSFGVSFTFCPRLATTGMVMALAGHASTQALQRVQSASVRSP